LRFNVGDKLPSTLNITHSSSSTTCGKILDFKDKWNTDHILTIDPNNNIYPPGHKWHALAEGYITHPILCYVKLIENASEIHVTDSSFYCFASLLSTKATKKVCYDRHSGLFFHITNLHDTPAHYTHLLVWIGNLSPSVQSLQLFTFGGKNVSSGSLMDPYVFTITDNID